MLNMLQEELTLTYGFMGNICILPFVYIIICVHGSSPSDMQTKLTLIIRFYQSLNRQMYQKHPNTYPMFLMFYDSSDSSLIFDASPHVTTRPRRENAEEKITAVPRQHLSAACPRDPTNLRRPKRPSRNLNSWKISDFRTPSHGKSWKCSGKFMENHE